MGEWAVKRLMEEGELLDWIESEYLGFLSWDVRDEAVDGLGLTKYGVEGERGTWEDKLVKCVGAYFAFISYNFRFIISE